MSYEPESKDDMSPAQRQAVEKAWDLLTEHFDRVCLVVDYDVDTGKIREQAQAGFWHGGSLAAIGMAEYMKDRILHCVRPAKSRERGDE